MRSSDGDIAFIIPVRDDAQRLEACLQSLRQNHYDQSRVAFVVVDNGSRDASVTIARDAGAQVLSAPGLRVSALRNMGAAATAAPVLAFVDADHLLSPDWIRSALEDLRASDTIGGVGALCLAPSPGTWVQRAYDRLRGRVPGRRPTSWLGAGNMAVKRAVFEEVSGFDESLETCEDVDLCKRVRAAGYELISDSRLVNVHVGDPATLTALFRGELWRGRSNLIVSFRPPVTIAELPSALIPIADLILLLGAGFLLLAMPYQPLGLACLAGVVALSALRALRMASADGSFRPGRLAANLAVALVYDLARALSLVARAGHRARRS
jgi:GT2 family glycosyltransferase